MKEQIELLRDSYKKRIETVKLLLEGKKYQDDPEIYNRLTNKAAEYRSIVSELEKILS